VGGGLCTNGRAWGGAQKVAWGVANRKASTSPTKTPPRHLPYPNPPLPPGRPPPRARPQPPAPALSAHLPARASRLPLRPPWKVPLGLNSVPSRLTTFLGGGCLGVGSFGEGGGRVWGVGFSPTGLLATPSQSLPPKGAEHHSTPPRCPLPPHLVPPLPPLRQLAGLLVCVAHQGVAGGWAGVWHLAVGLGWGS
jgi:hypothetical protein